MPRRAMCWWGDGWSPLSAAAGTAGFFLLLTAGQVALAFACGIGAIVAVIHWLWGTDRPPPVATAEVADGVRLPLGARGPRSHSWWGTLVLATVDMTVFACFVYAHVHVAMAGDVCPPVGSALPPPAQGLVGPALWLLGSLCLAGAVRALREADVRERRWVRALVLAALLCSAAGFALDFHAQAAAGQAPTRNAWSATVAMLLGYQGFHLTVLVLMACFLFARTHSAHLQPGARATLDNTALLWHTATLQALLGAVAIRLTALF